MTDLEKVKLMEDLNWKPAAQYWKGQYLKAHEAREKAIAKLEEITAWVEELGLYSGQGHLPVLAFRGLPELIKELKS